MKNVIALFTLVSIAFAGQAQFNGEKDPYMTRSLSNDGIKNVKVRTSGGSISVEGVDGNARLEVFVRPNNGGASSMSKEEIKKKLEEDYELDIDVSSGKLTATAKQKTSFNAWKKGLSISFKVYVPKAVSTDLSTSGGSINIAHLNGNQEFSTSGGSLHVDDLTGNINGKTSGGSIDVRNTKDKIDLKTSGGSIHAENLAGTINLATSGGSLTLNNLDGKIDAHTSGGSVHGNTIKGELAAHTSGGSVILGDIAASLDASTSGGSIRAEVKEIGKYVTLKNSGGNIDLQLPDNKGLDLKLHASRIAMTTAKAFSGSKDENSMDGTINGGGIPVTVRASSGRLSISMK